MTYHVDNKMIECMQALRDATLIPEDRLRELYNLAGSLLEDEEEDEIQTSHMVDGWYSRCRGETIWDGPFESEYAAVNQVR